MSVEAMPDDTRSYGCSMGCGNAYDYVLVDVKSADTLFLCVPCYVRIASDMLTAILEADDPNVMAALELSKQIGANAVPGPSAKRGRKNAPAEIDDPAVFEAFDSVVEADELSEEFR